MRINGYKDWVRKLIHNFWHKTTLAYIVIADVKYNLLNIKVICWHQHL